MRAIDFIDNKCSLKVNVKIPDGSTICYIDSSFNPPNKAHLKLAQLCRDSYPDSFIIFMLGTGNADKPAVPVDEIQVRVDMMEYLVASEFQGDSKAGCALTTEPIFINKARVVYEHFPRCRSVFALGFDTLVRIGDQKYYKEPVDHILQEFFEHVEVVLLTRNKDEVSSSTHIIGLAEEQTQLIAEHPQFARFLANIHIYDCTPETDLVSSSRARSSRAELYRCVPAKLAKYIEERKIYDQM